jgi:nucleoid-associated protein YgaU
MPRKKTTTKTTKPVRKTKVTKSKKVVASRKESRVESFVEYLKLGESYTSLVLGIVAVIIGTLLLLSIVHNRQAGRQTPEVTPTIAESKSFDISPTGFALKQSEDTTMPEQKVSATPASKAQDKQLEKPMGGKTYTVAAGDNLWMIAEKVYGDGYQWVKIAQVNNLSHPGDIEVGDKLSIPQVKKDVPTVHTADDDMSTSVQQKIVVENYKVMPGDDLWDIAVRAYGDGYQWVKIAKANNLSEPNIIHKDNVLKIPRG